MPEQRPRWIRRPEGSNWGEFGVDDQIGRMNLITPDRVREAVATVRDGRSVNLSLPLDLPAAGALFPARQPPRLFACDRDGTAAYLWPFASRAPCLTDVMSDDLALLWTQYSTQWDSLAHMGYRFDADGDGIDEVVFYNGWRADDIVPPALGESALAGEGWARHPVAGFRRLGIDQLATTCVQGPAVLIDLRPTAPGAGPLRVGHAALAAAMAAQGVEVRPGDMVCLHTGFGDHVVARTPDLLALGGPALDGEDPALLDWITASGVAALISDHFAVEHVRAVTGDSLGAVAPLHEHCLFKLGVHLGELWYLSELAALLAAAGRHRFLLTAPPLRLPGAVGSPVTPVATL